MVEWLGVGRGGGADDHWDGGDHGGDGVLVVDSNHRCLLLAPSVLLGKSLLCCQLSEAGGKERPSASYANWHSLSLLYININYILVYYR